MISKLKVTESRKEFDTIEMVDFIKVSFDMIDENDEVVESRILRFDLGATTEEISVELNKYLGAFIAEQDMFEANKEKDELNKQADEVVESLSELEIEAPELDIPDEGTGSGGQSNPQDNG